MKIQIENVQKHLFSITMAVLFVFIACIGFSQSVRAISVGCDDAFVQLANAESVINVSSTGANDTDNIQCALDAAIDMGIPVVKLAANTFSISTLSAIDFNGSLEGVTKATTIVNVINQSIDCAAMESLGNTSAVIKFAEGEPRIRFMTIKAISPCMIGKISAILHFTGQSALSSTCGNDVIFGTVDRVIVDGNSKSNGPSSGILVAPEGYMLGGCRNTLLGTFKFNRSTVKNTGFGIFTNMKAGAQVDINFNEFRDNKTGVFLVDTNQNTTITTNVFFGESSMSHNYLGISILTESADAPNKTRVVIDNNTFNVTSASNKLSVAISGKQDGHIANLSSVVTNNKFNLMGSQAFGILFTDISNAHVSANNFTGDGKMAVFVSGNTPVSGWTITANKGLGSFTPSYGADLLLNDNTSECIIGPGQNAIVTDSGTGNTVLPQ